MGFASRVQQLFRNPDWVQKFREGQDLRQQWLRSQQPGGVPMPEEKKAEMLAFWASPEAERLRRELGPAFDDLNNGMYSIGHDGMNPYNRSVYDAHIAGIKCLNLGASSVNKELNVKAVMLVPHDKASSYKAGGFYYLLLGAT